MAAAHFAPDAAAPRSMLRMNLPAVNSQASRDWLALAYFAFVTLMLLYRVVLNLDGWAGDPGDPLLNAWILAWDWHALVDRVPQFFNTNIFFPYSLTLAYSESLLGDLPIAGPIIALTGNPLLATNVLVLLSFIIGGWTMYFAVSRMTGSGWAGLIAGTIFAFNLERFAAFTHLQLLTTQWLPLMVYCLDRMLTQGRWKYWGGLVIFFNLQFLSSYYIGLFMSLTLGLLLVGYLLAGLVRVTPRLVGQLAAFAAVVLAINVPLAMPYFTLAKQLGMQRTVGEVVALSGSPAAYVTADPRNWLYGALGKAFDANGMLGGEHYLFLGVTCWLLALAAVLLRKVGPLQRRRVWAFAGVLAVLVVLSWGPQLGPLTLPYRLLFEYAPGFKSIRVPARLIVLVTAVLAMLAGYGAAPLLERLGKWRRLVGGGLCLLVVVEAGFLQVPGVIVPQVRSERIRADLCVDVYQWLANQPDDPVILELPIPSQPILRAFTEATRQYYSTAHWKRTVNGYSGFSTRTYEAIAESSQSFPDPATIAWLQGLRVNLVILHRDDYEDEQYERLWAELPGYASQLRPVADIAETRVLQVVLPEWNAGEARPELGGKLRLLGYTSDGSKLKLYWQRLAEVGECELVLSDQQGRRNMFKLDVAEWKIGEVQVQEVAAVRSWRTLGLTVREQGQPLEIRAGEQVLPAVTVHRLR
ncbi:MAG: hypothetical protein ACM3VW_03050 [Bacteroidota bacterium]